MRKVKRGLATILVALLMVPAQPVWTGVWTPVQSWAAEEVSENEEKETASPGNAQKAEEKEETKKESSESVKKEKETSENDEKKADRKTDEILYNTGTHVYSVVDRDAFFEDGLGDAYFEEDGSYTINIPEKNPFFPYEVEFTYQGKSTRKWFMTPDAQVKIGGHVFTVEASFDENAVNQMSLKVGNDTVVVYPEKKEFTDDDEGGINPASLLPLEEKYLTVDLTGYTPLELTKVAVDELFIGGEVADGDKVIWKQSYNKDDYTISASGDKLDLSHYTCNSESINWEMIVGKDNQLAVDNIRYRIDVKVTPSWEWLTPTVYIQDSEEKRIKKELLFGDPLSSDSTGYWDFDSSNGKSKKRLRIVLADDEQWNENIPVHLRLDVNKNLFENVGYAELKVYEGNFTSAKEAVSGKNITNELLNADMTQKDAGYLIKKWQDCWVTIVALDADGDTVGCLPFCLYVDANRREQSISCSFLYTLWEGHSHILAANSYRSEFRDGVEYITQILYKEYAADQIYYLQMDYNKIKETTSAIIAAYTGKYASIEEAKASGAKDIKDELFNSGYGADYSKGVFFTIFVGEDGINAKEMYHYMVQAETGQMSCLMDSNTHIFFGGLRDAEGKSVSIKANVRDDSYAEGNYLTLLVDKDVDLSQLAPVFSAPDSANVYAGGSKKPEISGKSYHDFSQGPVQYTVSAENGVALKNVWLQIVKAGVGNDGLYINSLDDKDAKTKTEDGVIYSTREMIIDGRYNYLHDIVLINLGTEAVPMISADLVSDEVEMDKYWTLKGDYTLPDIENGKELDYGEAWNLAKLRIKSKEGMNDGREISGTLTIRSGEKELMVLTLTGTVGDPSITTKEIPQAVKYVPYGTMIQNSNKYSWNQVSYRLIDGKLPEGMIIRQNGEIYGVPQETGDFTFTVRMQNSYDKFEDSERTFTLTVLDNTDDNVEGQTAEGYTLTDRIQDMTVNSIYEQTVVSEGVYGEFTFVFLDGEKLVEGVDYVSEAGSTRITIRRETLQKKNTPGRHTLGIEFRTEDKKELKPAAQNYEIKSRSSSNSSGTGGGGSKSTTSSSSQNTSNVLFDAKKGYYNAQTGIITGEGDGYSKWIKDEFGWKLIYGNNTPAVGSIIQLADGTAAEQVLWEQVNGVWYAFGITGYLKSGWVCDYQLGGWYLMTEYGRYSGWYGDEQDHCVYYLEPETGKPAVGWKMIDGKWYYFNEISTVPTWNYNAVTGTWVYNPLAGNKPYGAAYINEYTPDGYFVGIDGVWDGQDRIH